MTATTIVTTKGQIVIPALIRKHFHIKKGTKLCVTELEGKILLQPLTRDYFVKVAGILKSRGRFTKSLLADRARQKAHEDRA